MKITKMHGLGNDFIIFEGGEQDYSELARKLCMRRLNIGADGLLVVCPSKNADIKMRIINADGSEAEMCGNGIRCFARYVYDRGIVKTDDMSVETLAGIMYPQLIGDRVKVDMGEPYFDRTDIPMTGVGSALQALINVDGKQMTVSSLLMGVPHTVVITESFDDELVRMLGPKIETNEAYPKKTNVNFVRVIDQENIWVSTWERGAGLTLACGTGCCASVVACALIGKTAKKVRAHVAAGELDIEYALSGRVFMTGAAAYVFEGETLS